MDIRKLKIITNPDYKEEKKSYVDEDGWSVQFDPRKFNSELEPFQRVVFITDDEEAKDQLKLRIGINKALVEWMESQGKNINDYKVDIITTKEHAHFYVTDKTVVMVELRKK